MDLTEEIFDTQDTLATQRYLAHYWETLLDEDVFKQAQDAALVVIQKANEAFNKLKRDRDNAPKSIKTANRRAKQLEQRLIILQNKAKVEALLRLADRLGGLPDGDS